MGAKVPAADAAAERVLVRVAPGRSVHAGGRRFGPGEEAGLPAEDAARLAGLGFVAAPGEPPPETAAPQGASVRLGDGVQVKQG